MLLLRSKDRSAKYVIAQIWFLISKIAPLNGGAIIILSGGLIR
jgi:hypothetical protein